MKESERDREKTGTRTTTGDAIKQANKLNKKQAKQNKQNKNRQTNKPKQTKTNQKQKVTRTEFSRWLCVRDI
jgi:hypothetical protein